MGVEMGVEGGGGGEAENDNLLMKYQNKDA